MFSDRVAVTSAPEVLAQVANAGDEASSRLTLVIIGLLVLAVVITIVTVVFWRMTRPRLVEDAPAMRWINRPSPVDRNDAAGQG